MLCLQDVNLEGPRLGGWWQPLYDSKNLIQSALNWGKCEPKDEKKEKSLKTAPKAVLPLDFQLHKWKILSWLKQAWIVFLHLQQVIFWLIFSPTCLLIKQPEILPFLSISNAGIIKQLSMGQMWPIVHFWKYSRTGTQPCSSIYTRRAARVLKWQSWAAASVHTAQSLWSFLSGLFEALLDTVCQNHPAYLIHSSQSHILKS